MRGEAIAATHPIQSVLIVVFFLSIGLLIDLNFVVANLGTVIFFVIAVLAVKTAVNVVLMRLVRQPWEMAFPAGTDDRADRRVLLRAGGHRLANGSFSGDAYRLAIAVIAVSLLVSPLWMVSVRRFHIGRAQRHLRFPCRACRGLCRRDRGIRARPDGAHPPRPLHRPAIEGGVDRDAAQLPGGGAPRNRPCAPAAERRARRAIIGCFQLGRARATYSAEGRAISLSRRRTMRILAGFLGLAALLAVSVPHGAEAAPPPRVEAYSCGYLASTMGPRNVWQTWFRGSRHQLFGPDLHLHRLALLQDPGRLQGVALLGADRLAAGQYLQAVPQGHPLLMVGR